MERAHVRRSRECIARSNLLNSSGQVSGALASGRRMTPLGQNNSGESRIERSRIQIIHVFVVIGMKWYVVHAYSGYEKSVQRALKDRIERAGMQDKFGQILIPVEEVIEMKSGQKNISERKFFPGYVLIEMEMSDESWHLVKNTDKVTGFVGGSVMRPTPISQKEVDNILQQIQEGIEKPKPKILFEIGEAVRVKEGPFTDFHGNVEDVNYDKSKLRVSDSIFGRPTPVELDFNQVEKS